MAAIIIEPVQGEGGFYVASPSFLQALRKICDQHGILLICDEIQTGFCRTGKTFATEYSGVEPDIMTLAKSLAGGFPLSAVVGKSEIMNAAKPGGLGGTYAGSPIACAAALAVLEVIEEERLNQQALVQGEQIKARLHQLAERFDSIGNIRGPGAMVAMELVKGRDATKPDPDLTKRLVAEAGKRGLVLLACGVRANVIRFLAPLTASPALIDEGLDLLEQALAAASQG
ncbi:5-aminovalerate aminotransferase DavT [compost metagenome]